MKKSYLEQFQDPDIGNHKIKEITDYIYLKYNYKCNEVDLILVETFYNHHGHKMNRDQLVEFLFKYLRKK